MGREPKVHEITKVSQYCLDTLSVAEFVKSLPSKLQIYSLRFRGTYRSVRKQLAIAEYLKNMGVLRAAATAEAIDIRGKFDNLTDRRNILANIERIAKSYRIPVLRFHVEHVTIMDKTKTSSLSFKRMFKQIKFPNDKRKKKLVLGMTEGKGKDHNTMLADLSAKKIVCTLAKTEKTIVMCSEEIVKK